MSSQFFVLDIFLQRATSNTCRIEAVTLKTAYSY